MLGEGVWGRGLVGIGAPSPAGGFLERLVFAGRREGFEGSRQNKDPLSRHSFLKPFFTNFDQKWSQNGAEMEPKR